MMTLVRPSTLWLPAQPASALQRLLGLILVVLLPAATVLAQALPRPVDGVSQNPTESHPVAGGTVAATPAETLESRLAEARAQLAAFSESDVTNAPPGASVQEVWLRRAGLHRLVRLYEQQLSNIAALEKTRARKAEIAREARAWSRFTDPPPYSFLLTDRLREEIQAERQKINNAEAAASVLSQLIEENRANLAETEERLRQLHEQLESSTDPTVTTRLSWQRELERLRSRLAPATLAVLDSEQLVGQELLAESRLRLSLLQRQLVFADAGAKFTHADLEKITQQVEGRREQLEQELSEIQARQVSAVRALEAAREEFRVEQSRAEPRPATSRALELVSVREAQLDALDAAISSLRLLLEAANIERTIWELRFNSFNSPGADTLRQSERRLTTFARRLNLWRDYTRQQLAASSSQVQLQETQLNSLHDDPALQSPPRQRSAALAERDQMLLRQARAIDRLERLTQRWAEGMRSARQGLPFAARALNLFTDARSFLQRLWNFEVFTAEDTVTVDGQKITGKRSVTIGKTVGAILILVVGYFITGFITSLLERVSVNRFKIDPNQARLVHRWLRSLLVVGLLLFSLVSVKIPLTIFAFAGGALAIGLGFGMQTILKNFVSGLILLFERPVRVGDLLDVGGQKGTVTSIGLRASILQAWDGTETLIPNSFLLESNVTNWTYSDGKVRFAVSVGVAYASDPRQVMQLLAEVAARCDLVEKDPKPQVLFSNFGDSTLVFELRFWVNVSRANPAQASSNLRVMIAGSFAELGIVIDYPQRDIHLHATRPLQVEVLPSTADARSLPTLGSANSRSDSAQPQL